MNLNDENLNAPCIVCHEVSSTRILLGESLADASDFRDPSSLGTHFRFELATCQNCGHNSIQTNNPCLLPTRKYKFIKYGEPIEHYPLVKKLLESLNINFSNTSIHAFSYKDFQLANFLGDQLNIADVNLVDWLGCSDDWLPVASDKSVFIEPKPLKEFFAEINNSSMVHRIVIVTRFFDHVASQDLLRKMIRIASPTVHLVFDLNDYERLSTQNTLEFIWNERRNFFHRIHLEHIISRENLGFSMFTFESQEVSPTLSGVITNRIPAAVVNSERAPSLSAFQDFGNELSVLRQRWKKELTFGHKLAIIGASHKGISLAQFVLDSKARFSLHDDKEALKGRTPPVIPPLGHHSISGFDFSQYSHAAMTTTRANAQKIMPKLQDSGFTGKFLNFDCRLFN